MLIAGGLTALQAAAVVAGLPFAVIVFFMVYALFRGLRRDELILYRIKQRFRTDEEAHAHMAEETADEK